MSPSTPGGGGGALRPEGQLGRVKSSLRLIRTSTGGRSRAPSGVTVSAGADAEGPGVCVGTDFTLGLLAQLRVFPASWLGFLLSPKAAGRAGWAPVLPTAPWGWREGPRCYTDSLWLVQAHVSIPCQAQQLRPLSESLLNWHELK